MSSVNIAGIEFDDVLDSDGELEYICYHWSEDRDWIDKESAKKLITHLQEVFEL